MANSKVPLYTVPVASTSFLKDARPVFGPEPCIRYVFKLDGQQFESGIGFTGIAAWSYRAERSCTTWHIDGVYDTLVEIVDSEWAREVKDATHEPWKSELQTRHYMIYLDSMGCFEFIADAWHVLPTVPIPQVKII